MEKFSSWRDKGTGISPFMPVLQPSANIVLRLLGSVIFVVKIPLLIVTFLLSFIWPSPSLIKLIVSLLFSIPKTDFSVQGVKKNNLVKVNACKPSKNQLIVVNYSSPIDSLLLAMISNVSWKSIVFLIPAKGKLYKYSMWGFTKHAFLDPVGVDGEELASFESLREKLVFYFIEGTPSNNMAILPFSSLPPQLVGQFPEINTLMLKLQPAHLTLPIPTVSFFSYFYSLLTSIDRTSLSIAKYRLVNGTQTTKSIEEAFKENSWNIVGSSLDINSKASFYVYYKDHKVKKE